MKTNNPIVAVAMAALLAVGCGSNSPTTAEVPIGTSAARAPGGASVSILPMMATTDVLSVVLTVDGTSNYAMGYNGANGNFYSQDGIELSAGEHDLIARAYSVACTADTCIPGVDQVGEGTATVTITSGQVAAIYMRILDASAPDPDTTNHAPIITAMVISSVTTGVDTPIQLNSVAMDPDGELATAALVYRWEMYNCSQNPYAVTFGDQNGRTTSWASSLVQDCSLTLTVYDSASNVLIDSMTTPPIFVLSSGMVINPYSAWFIPRPTIQYILATDSAGTVCVYDHGNISPACHLNLSEAVTFDVYVDAGIDAPSLDEIDATLATDDYCLGGGLDRVSESDMPSSFWVQYQYVWTPGNTYNTPCTFNASVSHLGMIDNGAMTLRNERFAGYFAMGDIESSNDSTGSADYIPEDFRSVVSEGSLGTEDYYAIRVNAAGEAMVIRTAAAFSAPEAGFDTRLELFDSNAAGELITLAWDDNSGPGNFSELAYTFPATAQDHTYYVRVRFADGSFGASTDLYSLYFDRFQ